MANKIKLMFDADILFNTLHKNSNRTGIYVVAYNIANELSKNKDIELSFYLQKKDNWALIKALKQAMPQFENISFFPQPTALEKVSIFAKYKRKEATFFLIRWFWRVTKFLFDCLNYIPSKIFKKKIEYSFDVYFSPMVAIPQEIAQNPQVKKMIFLHDTIPLVFKEYFKGMQTGKYWFLQLTDYMKSYPDTHYIANSDATKKDFLKYVPELKPEQITVIPLAASEKFYRVTDKQKIASALKKYNIPTDKKYIFSLCTLEPRKNLIRAVKTFVQFVKQHNINDLIFVLGGGHWKEFIEKLNTELGKIPENLIIKAGYIDDEDLASLYSDAEWFVYTSQYEGFGLPPLEAMACGCPVITSNNSSLPEVVGDTGIMVDWDSDEQHIKAYEDYYFNEDLRVKNCQKGLQRAKQFSWQKTLNTIMKEITAQ